MTRPRFVEHGEHGSSAAAPISREILGAYFDIDMVELKNREWKWAVAARKKAAKEKLAQEQAEKEAVEQEKAELERVRTELQQVVATAEAGREAAEEDAARVRILADAQAYEITQINNAASNNPAYIQLQSLEALKEISKDPASKIYFLDGSSPSPLPLMHLRDRK